MLLAKVRKKVLSKVQLKLDARDYSLKGYFFQLENENLNRPECTFMSTAPLYFFFQETFGKLKKRYNGPKQTLLILNSW